MLKRHLPAGFVVPAQPVEREKPPTGAEWIHEIKHDGYRMIVRKEGENVRLYSRNAIDWTARLPAIAAGAALLKTKSLTIDGEAVVIGQDGLTDFEALRRRGAGEVAVLYAFDLIELDGDDLRGFAIETRKATLASLLRKPGALRLSEHIAADGPEVFAHACRLGAEGIVSKRLGSPYRSGRVDHWLKIKNPAAPAVRREAEEDWGEKRWARGRRT
jgi:bifunctional non-homologous end joining protein LigD